MKRSFIYLLSLALLAGACKKNDPALPDNQIAFTASTQGLASTDSEITVTLNLGRVSDVTVPVVLTLQGANVTYGTHFTTTPAAADGTLNLTVPAGSSSVSFKLTKVAGILLQGTESLTFTITSAGSGIVLGSTKELKLSFSSIISTGSTLTLQGGTGGAVAINAVYVDLSANAQTSVARASWDLGFYSGTDFRVILNNTTSASAVVVNKTDINAVTAADVTLDALRVGQGQGNFTIIDDVTGDLTNTVIGAVSATDAENKVYVINRAGGTGNVAEAANLIKIRVLRTSTGGYTLQYAKLTETTFKTATITKNTANNFSYVNLDNAAAVNVEPAKDRWDFVWSYSMYFTGTLPYAFSDLVFTNYLNNTTVAEVTNTATLTYASYAEANIATTAFVTGRNTIGSNWRATTGTVGVRTDRFYVIKDSAGNVYKLKFVSFTTQDGGERGYPKIEYALVKKGA
ncbi:HmuY family protein [Mucilaginibacter myungsuensis]|uniref:Heme-binding HmuY-like protein n=1 Tax=Mucilaginibacter myungsuensis TaxID=649104 RepID=A0A929KWU2_9SPHI|nr:HmuY family protein [Mucilaginibacter myungsuensis]MBE9662637.1 hypothetical protein [Mucilaginibacter myungsuensis]MDN3598057.1 HmuY family protein [Mucilaginibacter myungsuensis]